MSYRSMVLSGCLLLASSHCFAEIVINVLRTDIDYSFGYDTDLTNCFLLPPAHTPTEFVASSKDALLAEKPGTIGNNWFVLFQAHTEQPLNLTNKYDRTMRTIKWGTPYDNAVIAIQNGKSAHDKLALLRSWYMEKVRKFGTFICIPPRSKVRFWSGYAAPMKLSVKEPESEATIIKEERPGGGLQVRFYSIPKGAICLTIGMFDEKSGKSLKKEEKNIDLQAKFAECVKYYNQHPVGGIKLPENLANPRKFSEIWDDEQIIKFYMDPTTTRLKPYVRAR